ncbi:MAG: 4-hydroxy-tetrahydrodipicolinate reductase [Acidobacteriaceae bacterium]|nr:4-hydroxy-tetrahydrodipicolinate reductase [Acidobacteriaceae bacterium]MBV9294569.1 4-hydroxy-tetrahydrodipicolinate reductase [Acidobacteriaceae bacterium]MBV9765321.1 4-hydroxy-tetrahydrodipicolinate reductase [Acidobacteriaceae bacterium]
MAANKKLALVGYGKMGHLIEQLAPEHGFEVALRLDLDENRAAGGIDRQAFAGIDVAVEFSTPEAAPQNLKQLARNNVQAVSGTTGWSDHLKEVSQEVEEAGTGLVWSPNFSVGVAVFRKLVGLAAELLANEEAYGAWAWEIHHDTKKDAPSGTLLNLARTMQENGYRRNIDISSNRAGKHPGTHEIGFDSSADTITLRHVARSREGFAQGALKAARWILDRKGVYTFEDVLFGAEPREK